MRLHSVRSTFIYCAAIVLVAWEPTPALSQLKHYDASGKVGKDGAPGKDGASSGSDGTHAGPSEPGEPGGKIAVQLEVPRDASGKPIRGAIVIRGTVESRSRPNGKIEDRVEFGNKGYFFLDASGGKGGKGGAGGDGAVGAKGSDGSDATRFSSGSDGGRGGDGGDGGKGTAGARGGDGGEIRVRLDENDTHLVMLYTHDIKPGPGGEGGVNGRGGAGGRGGSGGSSYSWTETDTESYTDANGESQTRTVTTSHSNPGGSDGSSGSRGSDGRGDVSPGSPGTSGKHVIEVTSKGEVVATYPERYSVFIESYKVVPRSKNGILEPGEKVFVGDIKLSNQGKMPTPPNHPVVVVLENSNWAVSREMTIKVPKSLAPGESIVLKRPLIFDIPDTTIATPGRRFRESDAITTIPVMQEAKRAFTEGVSRRTFEVTFPIQIEPIVGWNTLAPGEKTRIEWKITNLSTEDIGTLANVKKNLRRDILQKMLPTGQASAHTVVFDDQGIELSESAAFLKAIENLKAGESRTIEGAIGFKKDAQPYTKATLDLTLELGRPQAPLERRAIQKQVFDVQVGQAHLKSEGANVLLITNHKTSASEVDAWREHFKKFGQKLDTYNLSYEGEIQFQKIFKDYKWGSVVLLNNRIEIPNGPETTPDAFLSKSDFFRTVSDNGIKLAILGSGAQGNQSIIEQFVMPSAELADREKFSHLDKFQTFARAGSEGVASQTLAEPLDGPAREIEVQKTYYIFEPTAEKVSRDADKTLAKAALKAQRELVRTKPGERHFVFIEKDVQEVPYDGMTKRWQAGRLVIQRTLDSGSDSAVILDTWGKDLHNRSYILSAESERNMALVLEMPDKVRALNGVMDPIDPYWGGRPGEERLKFGREMIHAILFDLAAEQRALLQSKRNFGFNREMLKTLMPHLQQFSEGLKLRGDPTSLQMTLTMELAAQIRHMSDAQIAGWQYLLPGMRARHLARATEENVAFLLDQTIGGPKSNARKRAEEQIKILRKEYAKAKPKEGAAEIREKWKSQGVVADTDIARNPVERVKMLSDRQLAAQADAERVSRTAGLRDKIAHEKSRFVTPLDPDVARERAVMEAIAPIAAPNAEGSCLAAELNRVKKR